jgi:hypothetical protein
MFAGASLLQDYYKDRLSLFVALGPVTMLPNVSLSQLKYAGNHYGQIDDAVWMSGMHSIGSSADPGWVSRQATNLFCKAVPEFCYNWTDSWENSDPSTDDMDRFKVSTGHNGGETPMKSILHFA